MNVTIQPSRLHGNITAPASKSSMQRACAAALLLNGSSVINNPGHSNDDKAAIDIIQKLGALIETVGSNLKINSEGVQPVSDTINCGESGLSIRMFTPIAALSEKEIIINGTGSLLERPMDFFDQSLPQLGVQVSSNAGKLPLKIKGPLRPANITVDGSLSSQFLTGLLMAYGAATLGQEEPVTIKVKDLKSKPYIDLTLDVMKQFGLNVPENSNYESFVFRPGALQSSALGNKDILYTVEGDWSGAAFLLVAGAIAGSVTIRGLDLHSTQADKAVIQPLMDAHAGIAMEAKQIIVRSAPMKGFDFDATDCPDLFPPLVALAAYCEGVTTIKGVNRLAHKESNRALTLQEEFGKMGLQIELNDTVMTIYGAASLKGTVVHSRHDHRIAMACAVAGLRADGNTIIEEAQAVRKSYPSFYNDLKSLGASLSLPFHTDWQKIINEQS